MAFTLFPSVEAYGYVYEGSSFRKTQTISLFNGAKVTDLKITGPQAQDFTYVVHSVSATQEVVYITFHPTKIGAESAILTIADSQGASQDLVLKGSGMSAITSLNLSTLNFGYVPTGITPSSTSFLVTNSGNTWETIKLSETLDTNHIVHNFMVNGQVVTSFNLSAGVTQKVIVVPEGVPSNAPLVQSTASVLVTGFDGYHTSTHSVLVKETPTSAVTSLNLSTLNFGYVPTGITPSSTSFLVTNSGNTLETIKLSEALDTNNIINKFMVNGQVVTSFDLSAGATQKVIVVPEGVPSNAPLVQSTASILVTGFDGYHKSAHSVLVKETPTSAVTSLNLSTLNFGYVPTGITPSSTSFLVTNSGNALETIKLSETLDTNNIINKFMVNGQVVTSFDLSAGATQKVIVVPEGVPSNAPLFQSTASILVTGFDGYHKSAHSVLVKETPASAVTSLNLSTLDFGYVPTGITPSSTSFLVTNSGNLSETIKLSETLDANNIVHNFMVNGQVVNSFTLSAGMTQKVIVVPEGVPSNAPLFQSTASLLVTGFDGYHTSSHPVLVKETPASAVTSLNLSTIDFGYVLPGTTTAAQSFTLTNTGNLTETITSITFKDALGNTITNFSAADSLPLMVLPNATKTINVYATEPMGQTSPLQTIATVTVKGTDGYHAIMNTLAVKVTPLLAVADTVSTGDMNSFSFNVLTNDTPNQTIATVVSTTTPMVTLPSEYAGLGSLTASPLTAAQLTALATAAGLQANSMASGYFLTPSGALDNQFSLTGVHDQSAYFLIGNNGTVNLFHNNAFDFLPTGETLTLNFNYTMKEPSGIQATAPVTLHINGAANDDVLVGGMSGAGNFTLNGHANGDTLFILLGNGSAMVNGGSDGHDVVSYAYDTIDHGITADFSHRFDPESYVVHIGFDILTHNITHVIGTPGFDTDTFYGNNIGNMTIDGGGGPSDVVSYIHAFDLAPPTDGMTGVYVNLTDQAFSGYDTLLNVTTVIGSSYNDIFYGSSLGHMNIDGGGGSDVITYIHAYANAAPADGVTGVHVNLGDQALSPAGYDTIANIPTIAGSQYNDIFYGNDTNGITIYGNGGSDTYTYDVAHPIGTTTLADYSPINGASPDTLAFHHVLDLNGDGIAELSELSALIDVEDVATAPLHAKLNVYSDAGHEDFLGSIDLPGILYNGATLEDYSSSLHIDVFAT